MPKDAEPLAPEDVDTIKRWIDAGAPDWNPPLNRKPVLPTAIVALIAKDLAAIEARNPRDLPFARYFVITHLYNAGYVEHELETYRLALSKLVNSLSWGQRIIAPQPIDPAKTIFRIDLRHYKWTPATWETILAENPYGISYDTAAAKTCYAKTRCELPSVRGDWFVARAAVPPLYHNLLDLPLTDQELEKRLQIDVARDLASDEAVRAGFNASGVSKNNRLIERHVSDLTRGAYWKSYDFKPLREKQADGTFLDFPERNLFDRPLGPAAVMPNVRQPFEHAGGELIWNLPNGLQAYMLIDGEGKRIDVGPIDIVSDPSRPDRTVINGLSCMSCHARGIKDKTDLVRSAVIDGRAAYTATEIDLVKALYREPEEFRALLDEDRARFTRAVKQTGGIVSDTDPVVLLAARFDAEVDLTLAASELGLTVEQFRAGLDAFPERFGRQLSPLRIVGGTVKRDLFVALFGEVVQDLRLGHFVPARPGANLAAPSSSAPPSSRSSAAAGVPPPVFDFSKHARTATEARLAQHAWAKHLGLELVETNSIGIQLLLIPPGEFLMGSQPTEQGHRYDESAHPVRLTKPFLLGMYEVTQEQYYRVMKSKPSRFTGAADIDAAQCPVETVSWYDAVEFCNKVSVAEGLMRYYQITNVSRKDSSITSADVTIVGGNGFRLPTEAEWEFACRAGTTSPFHFGEVNNGSEANVNGTTPYGTSTAGPYRNQPTVVGSYPGNSFGLRDMHGMCGNGARIHTARSSMQMASVLQSIRSMTLQRRIV